MEVAGVDGCRGGWLVVLADAATTQLRIRNIEVVLAFRDVLVLARDCEVVGVDCPIGLSDDGAARLCDVEARRVLGRRGSSVFPAPVRAALGARTYEEACERSLRASGKKLSIQAYNGLLPRVAEIDAAMEPDAALQEWVVEVHPEVSFAALNGGSALEHSKKRADGRRERVGLLSQVFADDISSLQPPAGAVVDDLLDACAAAWTAARYARGAAGRLPAEPSVDARGLRMEIVY